LVTREKDIFTTADVVPFIKYFHHYKPKWLEKDPIPEKLTDAVRWCKQHIVGLRAQSTRGPNPFLPN
jgi:hypothetical protein